MFQGVVPKDRIVDLANGPDEGYLTLIQNRVKRQLIGHVQLRLAVWSKRPHRYRILICGGDGTVNWYYLKFVQFVT